MINLCATFEISIFTRCDDMKGKMYKWGDLGQLRVTQGHRQYHHSIQSELLPIRL